MWRGRSCCSPRDASTHDRFAWGLLLFCSPHLFLSGSTSASLSSTLARFPTPTASASDTLDASSQRVRQACDNNARSRRTHALPGVPAYSLPDSLPTDVIVFCCFVLSARVRHGAPGAGHHRGVQGDEDGKLRCAHAKALSERHCSQPHSLLAASQPHRGRPCHSAHLFELVLARHDASEKPF